MKICKMYGKKTPQYSRHLYASLGNYFLLLILKIACITTCHAFSLSVHNWLLKNKEKIKATILLFKPNLALPKKHSQFYTV